MFCTHCGKTIPDGSTFCTHCGKPVVGATPPGEAAVPASAPVAPAGSTSQTDGSGPSSGPIVPAKTASKGKNVAIIVAAVAAVAVRRWRLSVLRCSGTFRDAAGGRA